MLLGTDVEGKDVFITTYTVRLRNNQVSVHPGGPGHGNLLDLGSDACYISLPTKSSLLINKTSNMPFEYLHYGRHAYSRSN